MRLVNFPSLTALGGGGYKVATLIVKWVLHTWFELTEDKGNGNSVKLGPEKDGYKSAVISTSRLLVSTEIPVKLNGQHSTSHLFRLLRTHVETGIRLDVVG